MSKKNKTKTNKQKKKKTKKQYRLSSPKRGSAVYTPYPNVPGLMGNLQKYPSEDKAGRHCLSSRSCFLAWCTDSFGGLLRLRLGNVSVDWTWVTDRNLSRDRNLASKPFTEISSKLLPFSSFPRCIDGDGRGTRLRFTSINKNREAKCRSPSTHI